MNINIGTKITKDFILERVQERDIFEKYLGLTFSLNINYTNPLRNDKEPGCRFYIDRKTQRIKFNDFSRGKNYDCFDVIQERHSLSFKEALNKIAEDFNLISTTPKVVQDKYHDPSFLEGESNAIPIITVSVRNFSEIEKQYWRDYGISGKQLKKFNVYALQKAIYFKGTYSRILYIHKGKEKAFCYYIDKEWKLYFPDRTKERFYNISQMSIQGYEFLPKTGKNVVITKSYKDVIGFDVYNIPAIAPQSENAHLNNLLIVELFERFKNVYILYDNDWPGMRAAVKRLLEYPNLQPLLFPKGRPKDLTDNMKQSGVKRVGEVLKQIINI